ncbi:MAG: G1 family glutamic endopeptidase [Solirubrobacteraceae bacterium]
MQRTLPKALIAAASFALAAAPSALADTTDSSNWAGYAIHGTGVSFQQISARWRQPKANCVAGRPTYSAAWVGLGGFSATSVALEQVGTELDCGRAGRTLSSAWFEIVPAPAQSVPLPVKAGDLVAAKVTVTGTQVVVSLSDLTQHKTFTKALTAPAVDTSSAEWIVEAPSDCISANDCQTLPLADFGSATFRLAQAVSSTGTAGSITNAAWSRTKIRLRPAGGRFVSFFGTGRSLGAATPLALRAGGSSFKVVYSNLSAPSGPAFSKREFVRSVGLTAAAG